MRTPIRGPERLAWHLVGIGCLATLPSLLWFSGPLWAIPVHERAHIIGHIGIYVLAAAGLAAALARGSRPTARLPLIAGGLALAAGFAVLLLTPDAEFSRPVLAFCAVFELVWLAAPELLAAAPPARRRWILAALAVPGTAAVALGAGGANGAATRRIVVTNVVDVEVTEWTGLIGRAASAGGGLERLDDGYLLGTGDGRFFVLSTRGDELDVQPLETRFPLRRDRFYAEGPAATRERLFRVFDLLIHPGETPMLVVSHHAWDGDRGCLAVAVSATALEPVLRGRGSGAREEARPTPGSADGPVDDTTASTGRPVGRGASAPPGGPDPAGAVWTRVYESRPCVEPISRAGFRPRIHLMGGRMAPLDSTSILLSVGNPGEERLWSQDPASDLGKIHRLDLRTGRATVFTSGHRNPQGLAVADSGRVWSTEHGPRGGDELNLLSSGGNYGWPYETYGVEYEAPAWPEYGRADTLDLTPPAYAWVPSIGVSSLIRLRGDGAGFRGWAEDLLVGSLRDRALHRVRIVDGRAAFVERMPLGQRVRDLIEGPAGEILLWTDRETIMRLRPAPSTPGGSLYGQCAECHPAVDGSTHGLGPDLAGVFGRRIGAAPGFGYSAALSDWDGRWTARELTRFLRDPDATAPGTSMEFEGIADSVQVARLIEHLRTLEPTRP